MKRRCVMIFLFLNGSSFLTHIFNTSFAGNIVFNRDTTFPLTTARIRMIKRSFSICFLLFRHSGRLPSPDIFLKGSCLKIWLVTLRVAIRDPWQLPPTPPLHPPYVCEPVLIFFPKLVFFISYKKLPHFLQNFLPGCEGTIGIP